MEFKDLGLNTDLQKAVTKLGFITPTEIQEKTIPILAEGSKDFVGLAQTGTGKTAAYGLPLIQHVDFKIKNTQGLVICPTRELCMQITKDLESFAKFQPDANILPVYGGASIEDQIRRINRGVQIVVATPGRLLDLISRKAIKLNTVQRVILDEADEMLNMGFKEDIDSILEQTPDKKRVWLFSATMPNEVRRIAENYMDNPIEILVGKKNSPADNISHRYSMMKEKDRYYALKRILDYYPDIYGLIFCRTRRETGAVSDKLEKEGYNVVALHGDLSQSQRDSAMKKFRERTAKILVATDVAARGLDVEDISHVIHYNLPDEVENYTHRSGRTARAGRSGISLALANTRELNKIHQIERIIQSTIEYTPIPCAEDIGEKKMYALMDRVIKTQVDEDAIERYWPVFYEKLKNFSADDIVMKFISAELNTFLSYYKNSGNLNANQEQVAGGRNQEKGAEGRNQDKRNGKPQNRNLSGASTKFFINLGDRQNMNKGALVRLICTEANIASHQIGRIDVYPGSSNFEVDNMVANTILPKVRTGIYEGKTFNVNISRERELRSKKGKRTRI